MSISQKFKEFIAPMDEDDVLEVEQEEDTPSISEYERPKSKVNHLPTDTKMVLFEPRSFDESEEIAKRLKENKAAVVNLHKLQRDYAQRTIDFLTGVIFALDGSIQKIGHNVILCTPRSVAVHGEISLDASEEDLPLSVAIEHYRGNEEFVRRLQDQIDRMERWNRVVVTPFFSPDQIQIAERFCGHRILYRKDGGYAQAERCRLAFLPWEEEVQIPVLHLKAKISYSFGKLAHRDVLGALMNLGIERDKTGDLIVEQDAVHMFVDPDIGNYLIANLTQIKRCAVHLEPSEESVSYEPDIAYKSLIVSSLRLDTLVAALARLSRAKAADLIRSKQVKVDHVILEQTSYLCDNTCVISIRGHGRFQLKEVVKETKKGNLVIEVGMYQ